MLKMLAVLVLLFAGTDASASDKVWPGWYLTKKTPEGMQMLYAMSPDGKVNGTMSIALRHGTKFLGLMSARCKPTGHGFQCRFLDKKTKAVVTTKSYSVIPGVGFVQRDTGLKACKISAAAGGRWMLAAKNGWRTAGLPRGCP